MLGIIQTCGAIFLGDSTIMLFEFKTIVWLEKEYGGHVELTTAMIAKLQTFQFKKTS